MGNDKHKHKKSKSHKRKHSTDSESKKTKSKKCKRSKRNMKESGRRKSSEDAPGPSIPEYVLEKAKEKAPMTKEEWEKTQSIIRKVYDEDTGRTRLIKGDGEILEEIVSKDQHREINLRATACDGMFFQKQINKKK